MSLIFRHFVCVFGFAALLAVPAAVAQTVLATGAAAELQSCERMKDPAHQAALAAAQAWHNSRWAPLPGRLAARRGWITGYLIPPPPRAPLGIASFARAQNLGAEKDAPTAPIAALAQVAKFLCVTGAPAADGSIAVHFLGLGLRFREGSGSWSKPLRRLALLHALVLRLPTPDAAWAIAEDLEARTALIPGTRLSPPAADELSAAPAPPGRTASAKLRR